MADRTPIVCESKRAAIDVFTKTEDPDPLFVVDVTIERATGQVFVFAPGPVSARAAVMKCATAERVRPSELWGWVKDELAARIQQDIDTLEGGTGA